MNYLPNIVNTANRSMYAGDTDLSERIRNDSDFSSKLVPEFMKICEWLRSNKLSLNALKIEFMIIGSYHRVGEQKDTSCKGARQSHKTSQYD